MKRFGISLTLIFASALLASVQARAEVPAVGISAPDFSLATTDGKMLRLSSLRGHVVVVNFFATWCPPCRAETPDLVAASRKYASEGVIFLGVDDREKTPLVQVWANGKGVRYPIVMDRDGAVEENYDVRAIPTTYILDKAGVIRYRQLDVLEGATLAGALDAVVADRPLPETKIAQTFDATANAAVVAVRGALAGGKPADAIDAGKKAASKLSDIQSGDGSSSIDYFKATQENDALDLAMADAYAARAQTETGAAANADLAQEALQRGQVAEDREQFADAYAMYAKAVSLDSSTASDSYNGLFLAAIEQKQYDKVIEAAKALAVAVPDDPESWLLLTSANLAAKDYPSALDAAGHALSLASAAYAKKPTDKHASYELGRVWLKMGRAQLAAGNTAAARALLRNAPAVAPGTIVAEQASEQFAALEPAAIAMTVSGASSALAAAETPAKLWVLVRNPSDAARSVNLAATGLPAHWLLSFCYAKVCQPYKSTINLAAGGSLRVELQVVPLAGSGGAWSMHVSAAGGSTARVNIAAKSVKATATVSATSGT
jgi:cytochrome c biogenesis protein CcmG, thiol:disulfide interchange protein DsbE